MLVTVSVLDAKSCGAETVPELVTLPHTTLPIDTPPLMAKVQSRLLQSSRPVEAAQRGARERPAYKARRPWTRRPPCVVKFPALAGC